jgi:biotin carboxylase
MKKLLILGANPETIPLIETAKTLGIYTIVTDPDPNAPAKAIADRAININGMDVDSLIDFGKQESIDAILVGVADRLIEPYQKVAAALNLPCYANAHQCRVLTNKGNFNDLCKQYDVMTVPSIKLYKDYLLEQKIDKAVYPVFIKPIDRNSGKGMSVAYNEHELREGIKKAFDSTDSDYILLERYMDCEDVLISYTIVDGEPILSAMADRYTCKQQNKTSKVCLGAVYPSNMLQKYLNKEHDKVVKMLKGIDLKNAILTISAFVEGENFYYYDPGFRLQGEAPNLHMENINGFDQKKFLLDIALGNELNIENVTKANFENKHSATVWFLLKKGTISIISGFDKIQKDTSVFHTSIRLHEGDTVTESMVGTEAQVMARVYLSCKTKKELIDKIDEIKRTVKVTDIENNDQLLDCIVVK